MKKASPSTTAKDETDDMRPEYKRSDLGVGVRGVHYRRMMAQRGFAKLDDDVRAAFPTDEAVNQALRALMQK